MLARPVIAMAARSGGRATWRVASEEMLSVHAAFTMRDVFCRLASDRAKH